MNCSKCKKLTKPDWVAYSDSQTMLCYDCVDEFEELNHEHDYEDSSLFVSDIIATDDVLKYGT